MGLQNWLGRDDSHYLQRDVAVFFTLVLQVFYLFWKGNSNGDLLPVDFQLRHQIKWILGKGALWLLLSRRQKDLILSITCKILSYKGGIIWKGKALHVQKLILMWWVGRLTQVLVVGQCAYGATESTQATGVPSLCSDKVINNQRTDFHFRPLATASSIYILYFRFAWGLEE